MMMIPFDGEGRNLLQLRENGAVCFWRCLGRASKKVFRIKR